MQYVQLLLHFYAVIPVLTATSLIFLQYSFHCINHGLLYT